MNKVKIITKIIMIIFTLSTVYANTNKAKALSISDIISGGEKFIKKAEDSDDDIFDANKEQEAIDQAYYIILGIGIFAAFVVGTVLGIQFITSGAAGQAKVKEKLIPYVVGLFLVFGALGIWRIALNIGKTLSEAPPEYLSSNEEVTFVFSRSGESTSWYNDITGPDETYTYVRKEVGIYITDVDKIDLPIAHGKIKLSFDDEYKRVGNIIQNARFEDEEHIKVKPDSVEGCSNYTVSYDEATKTITFDYNDLNNVPNATEGMQICKFEIEITEWVSFGHGDRTAFRGKSRTVTEGDYYVYMDSITCYDKDNNNISKNVAATTNAFKYSVSYKQKRDGYISAWAAGL